MAAAVQCADRATFQRLLAEGGTAAELDSLATHLEQCARCGEMFDDIMRQDSVANYLSRSASAAGVDSAAIEKLRRGIAQLRSKSATMTTTTAARGAETYTGEPAEVLPDETESDVSFLAPAQQPDEIGRLGPYRVLRQLGAGGMGMVFLAEDPMLKRQVALKTMLPRIAASRQARERFVREARAAAAIEHPHIIAIHQIGEDRGVPYLAMPFLKGESLEDRLKRENKLPVAEAVRIICEMAEGLAAAHVEGLIHRDIKPANVWLETKKNEPRPNEPRPAGSGELSPTGGRSLSNVKLLDFGLARLTGDDAHLTHSGMIVGTPAFMAPEQARGEKVDARADLFSLGCVLYVMLTGQRPFTGKTAMAVLSSLATDTPKPPREVNPAVPASVSNLTMRLLSKKPEGRPPSATAVLDELRNLVRAAMAAAKKSGTPAASPPAEQKQPIKAPPPKSVATATPTMAMPRPQPAAPRRKRPLVIAALALLALIGGGFAAYQLIFKTKDGTLVVEVGDDDVDVRFQKGELKIYDTDGNLKYTLSASERNKTLPPGKYLVKVVGADGLKVESDKFEIIQGDKAKVRVTADPTALAVKPSADRRAPIVNSLAMKLVYIPSGKFKMGSSKAEIDYWLKQNVELWQKEQYLASEGPQHDVEITRPFYMSQTKVTVGQFRQFVKSNGYKTQAEKEGGANLLANGKFNAMDPITNWLNPGYPQTEDHPVVCVSWNDAVEFCNWLSKQEGRKYRLPTEAEWEYCCRAGTTSRWFSGDTEAELKDHARTRGNSEGHPWPVAGLKPNSWGLYDMHGNAWEWCQDRYDGSYYKNSPPKDPTGPSTGEQRVGRGSSWFNGPVYCRSATRFAFDASGRSNDIGFRVVLEAPAGSTTGPIPSTAPAASPFDRLDASQIPKSERFPWQPEELVAVIGSHRQRHWRIVTEMAMSPNGKLLASVAYGDRALRLWDPQTMQAIAELRTGGDEFPMSVAFSDDGRWLTAWFAGIHSVHVWDCSRNPPQHSWSGHIGPTGHGSARFGPGKNPTVFICPQDGSLSLWAGDKCLDEKPAHQQRARLAVAPGGKLVATTGEDGPVKLWETDGAKLKEIKVLDGQRRIAAFAFSADGKLLFTGNEGDRRIHVFEVDGAKTREKSSFELPEPNGSIYTIACDPAGNRIAVGGSRGFTIFAQKDGVFEPLYFTPLKYTCGWNDGISSLAFGTAEQGLFVGDHLGAVQRYKLGPKEATPFNDLALDALGGPSQLRRNLLSRTGQVAVSHSTGAAIWDLNGPAPRLRGMATAPGNPDPNLSPDGEFLALEDHLENTNVIELWDLRGKSPPRLADKFSLDTGWWHESEWLDGNTLAVCQFDGTLLLLERDGDKFKPQAIKVQVADQPFTICCSRGGKVLVTWGGPGKAARVWSRTGTNLKEITKVNFPEGKEWAGQRWAGLALGPDGNTLAFGGSPPRLYDLRGNTLKELLLGEGAGGRVCFSPDGKTLAGCAWGDISSVFLWDTSSGKKTGKFTMPGLIHSVAFAEDGRHLVTFNGNGTVYVLRLAESPDTKRMTSTDPDR